MLFLALITGVIFTYGGIVKLGPFPKMMYDREVSNINQNSSKLNLDVCGPIANNEPRTISPEKNV